MDPQDKQQLLQRLLDGRQALLGSLAGIDEDQAAVRPQPERWSVLEIVEHLANVEQFLGNALATAHPAAEALLNPERERLIAEQGTSRERRIMAPEQVRPSGRYARLGDALGEYLDAQARTLTFLDGFSGDLRTLIIQHPRLGPANGYEVVLLLAAHPVRHAAQIREARGLPEARAAGS